MNLCALCGSPGATADGLCAYHTSVPDGGADWATGNRIMCDFIHRGIVRPRPRALRDRSVRVVVGVVEPAAA
jgi:hypothetical protein